VVPLPTIEALPGEAVLCKIREVEVGRDGRPRILVRIYAGCGNCNHFNARRLRLDLAVYLDELSRTTPELHVRVPSLSAGAVQRLENEARSRGAAVDPHIEPSFSGFSL
jgi:hypothetical protein